MRLESFQVERVLVAVDPVETVASLSEDAARGEVSPEAVVGVTVT